MNLRSRLARRRKRTEVAAILFIVFIIAVRWLVTFL